MQPAWRRIFQIVGGSARQAHTSVSERRIAVQILQDRFRPWNALQVLRWGNSNLQNALHDGGLRGDGGRWSVPRRRSGMQRHDITGISLAQELSPLEYILY
jgi:hypothetical protein